MIVHYNKIVKLLGKMGNPICQYQYGKILERKGKIDRALVWFELSSLQSYYKAILRYTLLLDQSRNPSHNSINIKNEINNNNLINNSIDNRNNFNDRNNDNNNNLNESNNE